MARAYANYGQNVTLTPQTQLIPGREAEMIANNAGGVGFKLDDWERLMRFLIIGSEGGTYYVGEQKLTAQNAEAAIRCIKANGPRAVEMARDVNMNNRAPKVDQQLFVLALAMKHGNAETKAAVAKAAPSMLRIGTHLLHFAAMLDGLGGWNRSKRRIVSEWFTGRAADQAAFQMLKYQNRDGWTMRDVLRVVHPKAEGALDSALAWAAGKLTPEKVAALPSILAMHTHMLKADDLTPVQKALWGIGNGLPREALPTEALQDPAVQAAQLPDMPIHALIRNLGNLTASGLLAKDENAATVVEKITNKDTLRRARVHPFAILLATLVYKTGAGIRGGKTWRPVPSILAAMEDAYDLAFDNVTPTGKRILVGIDISGSMSAACMGASISASTAAVAVAVTLARLEPHALVVQFDTAVQRILPITKRTGIATLEATNGGGTDLSAPVRWASGEATAEGVSTLWGGGFGRIGRPDKQLAPQRGEFDAFVILTDNETWAGRAHPTQALDKYRREVFGKAKLICCAMTANHANIVDPTDPLQFGCAGLDANLPALVSDFIGR
jgi:60 kDa SS-A/Ro ribonucleoprotein